MHPLSPHTILVVEHNLKTQQVARAVLERTGYAVLEAQNGQSALEITAQECPDLILQDLGLPDNAGFVLVAQLRALPGGASRPILAFSAFLSEPEQTLLVAEGFTDCV